MAEEEKTIFSLRQPDFSADDQINLIDDANDSSWDEDFFLQLQQEYDRKFAE